MTETVADMVSSVNKAQEQTLPIMEKIFSAAQARAVYSEPVQNGSYTVITASEVAAGGGYGFGRGLGSAPSAATEDGEASRRTETAGGGGGGGGGGSTGRPVATIIIGPNGVEVRPIVDVTKIALAALTAWGAILPIVIRMRQARRG